MLSTDLQSLSAHMENHPTVENIGERLTTTRKYPILYRPITKCGSTYMHNLLNHLDGIDPRVQHDQRGIEYTDNNVMKMDAKFVILRNPIARFLSLYFDKVLGKPNRIGRLLIKDDKINLDPKQDLEIHRANCAHMISVIRDTLDPATSKRPNWHWREQFYRMKEISHFGFHVITLEGLEWQLPIVLSATVPQIKDALTEVPMRNVSEKMIDPNTILTPQMHQDLIDIYPDDFQMFKDVTQFWTTHNKK